MKRTGLLTAMFCVLIAVTAAMAWDTMDPVDYPAEVQSGSAITYGGGKIWGVFPDPSDSAWTYFEYYDPSTTAWVYPGQLTDLYFLGNPAITFQWRFGGEVLVVGNEDGDPDYPTLYSYSLAQSDWDEEAVEEGFSFGAGASIAFRPAPGYYGTYVAGWMYCLVGGGDEFWCYSLPGPGDVTVDGICPGETSLVADQTPLFIWGPVQGAQKYKLTISPNSDMSNPVLVDSTNDTTYQVTDSLDNAVYYWQSASRQGGFWTAGATHSFTLEGGWTQLASLPVEATYGASLAYEKDFYSGVERLVALAGGSYQYLGIYNITANSWDNSVTTPKAQGIGSAIVTHEAASSTSPNWPGPWVVFGENTDSLYYHNNAKPAWIVLGDAGEFPQPLGPGASMAYSIESGTPYLYLIVGQDEDGDPRNDFYRQELPTTGGGGQAGATRPASISARLINDPGRVTIEYQLDAPAQVKAAIFDAVGRQMIVLHSGPQLAGVHHLRWDTKSSGRRASPGAYFVLIDTGTARTTVKAAVQ